MKKMIVALLLCVASLSFAASFMAAPTYNTVKIKEAKEEVVLHYDADNASSIGTNSAATFEVAIRLTATELTEHYGKQIKKLQFWIKSATYSQVTAKVYEGSTATAPGAVLATQVLTVTPDALTDYTLDTPVTIESGKEYWVGYEVVATGGFPAGCDAGPVAAAGKSNMIYFNGAWAELTALAPTLTGNWNIRAVVDGTAGPDVAAPTVISVAGNTALPQAPMNLALTIADQSTTPNTLEASYNIGAGDVAITMTKGTKRGQYNYTGTIPAQADGTIGTVKFHVADDLGNNAWTPTYQIKWANPPQPGVFGAGEGFEGTFVPEGWNAVDVDGGGTSWAQFTGTTSIPAHGGTKTAWHKYGAASAGDQNGLLIAPKAKINATTPKLTFWQWNQFPTYYAYHGVMVSTTTDDPASFTELASIPVATAAWTQKEIDLSAYAGQNVYLAFKYTGTDADSWYLDDVKIDGVPATNGPDVDYPNCAAPTGTTAIIGSAMNVSTIVSDVTGIATVVGHYQLTGQSTWTDFTMTASKVTGTYTGTIPAQSDVITGKVKFTTTDTVTPTANSGDSPEFPIQWIVQPDEMTFDFEDSALPAEWTVLDADGDGNNWTTQRPEGFETHNTSVGAVSSASYLNDKTKGALTPDNYLITKRYFVKPNASVKFWVCAQDAAYAGEHYGLGVSTTGTAATDFTMVFQETLTAKAAGAWYEKTVDLSAYANQNVYVAFRHWDCTDMFWINMDDITLTNFGPAGIEENVKVSSTALKQNYPNPFNPTTSITFANKMDGNVKLTVMNAKGEQVATLVNGSMNAGNHTVQFDGSRLNSGVYFYKLETADATITQKMLLVK